MGEKRKKKKLEKTGESAAAERKCRDEESGEMAAMADLGHMRAARLADGVAPAVVGREKSTAGLSKGE